MTGTSPRRRALLLGCTTFADATLAPLRSPRQDVEELSRVLRDPDRCGYTVTTEVDCTSGAARRAIDGFLSSARPSDGMTLLYLSCHGVQDDQGKLYFAFADTEKEFLSSTAVSADWVRDRIYASRSRATLVLIDCCFSGAFIRGMRARSSAAANVESLVRDLPEASGVAVLTASGETEISFEDAESAEIRPSYFTDALITGVSSGAADLNRDGRITVDELYEYVYGRVVDGPSPQRPRRLGMGEGALVVADSTAAQHPVTAASAHPAAGGTATLHARGVLGYLSFDGRWVVIGKDGIGHIYQGEQRFHVGQLSGVAVKPATRLHYGFFQVIVKGVAPAPVVRFGLHAGRPPMEDGGSISFSAGANNEIRVIQEAVQNAIDAAHGYPQARPPAGHGTSTDNAPGEAAGTAVGNGPAPVPAPPAVGQPPGHSAPRPTPKDPAPASPAADHHLGERDGADAVRQVPMTALDGLVGSHFDVVLWLGPWRERWKLALSRADASAASVPPWLPVLARYLGGYVAPPGSTNAAFKPSPAYLAGFCAGMRSTWHGAVRSGLVPPDRTSFTDWLTRPPEELQLSRPLVDATLIDLQAARRRSRRAAAVRWTLRTLLWISTVVFVVMEIVAIAITVDGSWADASGNPAADQTSFAIIAHVGCLLPLTALGALTFIDLRRMYRESKGGTAPRRAAEAGRGPT